MLFAIDPVQVVVDEAVASGADLLVTHHPLLFRAVHTVAASTPKGRVVHDLIGNGIGLFVAHTNADSPPGGVSESLALALGLKDLRPPRGRPPRPARQGRHVRPDGGGGRARRRARRSRRGCDRHVRPVRVPDRGQWGPSDLGQGSRPAIGTVGKIEVVEERRVEMVLPRRRREAVIAALRAAHPYEEPAFDVFEQAPWASDRGTGRVGRLARAADACGSSPTTSSPLSGRPPSVRGCRATSTQRCGRWRSWAERATPCSSRRGPPESTSSSPRTSGTTPRPSCASTPDAPALVDVPHWAAEWTWLPRAAQALTHRLARPGD